MVKLSISKIRQALWQQYSQSNAASESSASALTGRIFHEIFSDLMGPDTEKQWQSVVGSDIGLDEKRLLQHVYDRLLGPRLTANQAALAESGSQVWNLWRATNAMCCWLSELLRDAIQGGLLHFDEMEQKWNGTDSLYFAECPLSWELKEPGWTHTVQVTGVADAVWNNRKTGRWCVLEFKLGNAAPAIDLAQVCLYYEMLKASGMGRKGAMALVSFRPEREELFFPDAELQNARQALVSLIGKLAGVTGEPPFGIAPESQTDSSTAETTPAIDESVTDEVREVGYGIVSVFAQYGIPVRLDGEPVVGPSFLRFPIMPGRGVRVSLVTARSEDLQIRLRLENPPLIRKDGGKLVIDVQRRNPEPVLFSTFEQHLGTIDRGFGSAKVPVGLDLKGMVHYADLSQSICPHLLVAGTAGSGKSEWMRSAIAGLLLANTPDTLRLVAIDPKYSAFEDLEGSPFLWKGMGIVHPEGALVPELLVSLIEEMEQRIRIFKDAHCDDLSSYVEATGRQMPRIVCFCDEYADLIAEKAARKEIESSIARLGAKARSSGVHLVLATQYPKADVVSSVIKANLSGRVCLKVTDAKQSQVILGVSGAEKLLGKGDLFFMNVGEPVRLQALFLSKEERQRLYKSPN